MRVGRTGIAAAVIAAAALAAVGSVLAASQRRRATPAFFEPQVLTSHDGVLRLDWNAHVGPAVIAGKRVDNAQTFTGTYPGPTLNVKPGDTIEISLKNSLEEMTNLHFHGFRVAPGGISDNVLRHMEPDSTSKIVVHIPKDHERGLYWYHTHPHAFTQTQVYHGLAGLISVGDVLAPFPQLHGLTQHVFALTNVQFAKRTRTPSLVEAADAVPEREVSLVNGRAGQTVTMHPGELQFWRVANISSDTWYRVALDQHTLYVLAEDGNTSPAPEAEKVLLMPPGKRFEFFVRAGAPGTYTLRSLGYNEGFDNWPARPLATLRVAGSTMTAPTLPAKLVPIPDLRNAKIAKRRLFVWNIVTKPKLAFTINGKVFDPNRVDARVKIGTVEEWVLKNISTEDHPFHIHTNDFQVIEIDGKPVPFHGYQDIVRIPRHGSVTIRLKARTFPGKAVFHCHILFHEDHGMMGVVQWVA
jgi:suppressor of ftsI